MIKQQCLFGTLLKTKFQAGIFCFLNPRACLKNHSSNLHASIYGIFCLHSVDVARYVALIQAKSPANCNAHLAESLFQTRSRACLKNILSCSF
ncbi:MAG: DUF6783 domain-containing protein, partial [Anaerobutyricum hallii]|uniref:DUF6783 domain-containing protein n=1 Tax=Anaerobutyricum hallii TaxID=39488 RepID=UPI0039913146